MNSSKLNPVSLGLAFGILWGISVLMMGLMTHYYAYEHNFVKSMTTIVYPSITGSILGGFMGFVFAFITGFLLAWLYNKFSCYTHHCCCCSDKKQKPVL